MCCFAFFLSFFLVLQFNLLLASHLVHYRLYIVHCKLYSEVETGSVHWTFEHWSGLDFLFLCFLFFLERRWTVGLWSLVVVQIFFRTYCMFLHVSYIISLDVELLFMYVCLYVSMYIITLCVSFNALYIQYWALSMEHGAWSIQREEIQGNLII